MRPVRSLRVCLKLHKWRSDHALSLAQRPFMMLQKRTHSMLCARSPSSLVHHPSVTSCMRQSYDRQFSHGIALLNNDNNLKKSDAETMTEISETGEDSMRRETTFEPANKKVVSVDKIASSCSGCGAKFQSSDPNSSGFVPKEKLDELHGLSRTSDGDMQSSVDSISPVICKRCFSLKQYNTALNISLSSDDYLRYLGHLREKKVLILLMIDISDFPGSVFPDLHTLISPSSQVVIIANKVDLIPKDVPDNFWRHFEKMLVKECKKWSLYDREVARVHFVSAKTGLGVSELAEDIVESWGNRGDVYLLGCTNAGKSTLFNRLLVYMCGVKPGGLSRDSNLFAPMATISQWPGTTLGLLSFPIMSVGKRQRLIAQAQARKLQLALSPPETFDDEYFERIAFDDSEPTDNRVAKEPHPHLLDDTEADDILKSIGINRGRKGSKVSETAPVNRFWLHDTPGAINDAQLINLLTSKELRLALPKKPLKPRTFILKPGQCLFVGGLARLDYEEGPISAYFTVFASSYLPVHVAKIEKADGVYERNIGKQLLKIPIAEGDRLDHFPPLEAEQLTIHGAGWKASTADVILSSAGWVAVTIGQESEARLKAYTPRGKGIFVREPPLFPLAVNLRGKRSQKGNRAAFKGKIGKAITG